MNQLSNSKVILFTLSIIIFLCSCKKHSENPSTPSEEKLTRVYVANENSESISVIDAKTNSVINTIDLSDGSGAMLMVHNIQVAPNGKTIWVTAIPMVDSLQNTVVVIDAGTNNIMSRIPVGLKLHLAHVVLDDACNYAFITGTDTNQVIKINVNDYSISDRYYLGDGHSPHGMRYSQGKLYIANLESKSLTILNTNDGSFIDIPLGGMAVQAGVTQDGKYAFASLYDTKEIARYNIQTGQLTKIALPSSSQGPVQVYPTPDSKKLLVCDQGVLLNRPENNKVYIIDIATEEVLTTITVGAAAHGVVVSADGTSAYITNSQDNSVSVIDINSGIVTKTIAVGYEPNGISFWYETGGMP